jgi:UDP-N-acetyl-D-mannosaminuronate dehydrogenase
MPDYTIGLLEGAYGELAGAKVVVLGAAYRGGVKETAFSGVFGAVEALKQRGATPVVHDPMYTDEELTKLGFTPYHLGEPADAAVVQADHDEYRSIGPADLPGVTAFIDGRRVSSAEQWPGVAYRVIGKATVSA